MTTAKLPTLPTLALLAAMLSPLLSASLGAQTVVYDFNDNPQSVSAATPSFVANGFASSIELASAYADVTAKASGSSGGYIAWQSHPAILNTSRYLQISITDTTTPFTLSEFDFTPKRFSSTNYASVEVRFSTSETGFDSNYVTIFSGTINTQNPISIDLTAPALQAAMPASITAGYFRIYTYDSIVSGVYNNGAWLGVDDIKIITAAPIPEPAAAAALLGGSTLAATLAFRRRRSGR